MATKLKYVDSHWLVFAVEGILATIFGGFVMFTGALSVRELVVLTSIVLTGFGLIELFNLLRRTHLRETWGLSLAMAVLDIAASFALFFTLFFTLTQSPALHLTIIAAYTIIRGLLDLFLGFKSVDDSTDKFIWVLCGICGILLGIAIFNSGHIYDITAFFKIFGVYMLVFGIANLIYGVHNRDQKSEYRQEQQEKRAMRQQAAAVKIKPAKTKLAKKASVPTASAKAQTSPKSQTSTKPQAKTPAKSTKAASSTKKASAKVAKKK